DADLDVAVAPVSDVTEDPRRPFVGRERELAELEARLEEALAGRGSLALLSGEPGIGKSRLAEELSIRARTRGAQVLVGRSWEAGPTGRGSGRSGPIYDRPSQPFCGRKSAPEAARLRRFSLSFATSSTTCRNRQPRDPRARGSACSIRSLTSCDAPVNARRSC